MYRSNDVIEIICNLPSVGDSDGWIRRSRAYPYLPLVLPIHHTMNTNPEVPIDFSNPAVRDYMSLIRYCFYRDSD